MPTYRFQGPDGRVHRAEAAPPEEAQAGLEQMWASQGNGGGGQPLTLDQQKAVAMASARKRAAEAGAAGGYKAAYRDADKMAGANAMDAMMWGHGAQVMGGVQAVRTAIGNTADRLEGIPVRYSAADAYKAGKDKFRAAKEQQTRERPVTSVAQQVLGSFLAPGMVQGGGWAAAAKSMPGLMVRGGALGAGVGALYGHGAGGVEGAKKGAVTGGVMGAALPPVVDKVAKVAAPFAAPLLARAGALAKDAFSPATMDAAATQTARAATGSMPARLTGPQARAAQAIQNAIERDAQGGTNMRPGVAPMHAGGDNLTALYEVAAKSPGPARQMIRNAVKDSRNQTYNEVEQDIGQSLGGKGDYLATMDELLARRRQNAAEGMAGIGDHLVTLDRDSVQALRAPHVQKEIEEAVQLALASPDAEVRNSAVALRSIAQRALDGERVTMSVREAQTISEALLNRADAAYKSQGGGGLGAALKGLGRAVRGNARTPERGGFKEYGDWLDQYASDSEAKSALELGRSVFDGGIDGTAEAVHRELTDMGPGVFDHYRKGVGEALLAKVRESQGDVGVMRRLLGDRNLAAKVAMAFPDDTSFARFLDAAEQRVAQANANNRYMGGSPTEPMRAVKEDLAGSDATDALMEALTLDGKALGRRAAKKAFKGLGLGVRPDALVDPGANMLLGRTASNADDLTAMLNLLQASRRASLAPRIAARAIPAAVTQASGPPPR